MGNGAAPVLLAASGLLLVVCLPLLLAPQLPLVDMPAHLARLEIIEQLLNGGPLAEVYEFAPGLVPNLLFDGIGWLLLQIVPVEPAGAIYLVLALAAQLFGTVLLHRSLHGRYRFWPLIAALLLNNLTFSYGYLSYLAGVGLTLLSLALWVSLRDGSPLLRLALGSLAAVLLFLAHIVPLIVYAAAICGYELQRAAGLRHRPWAALAGLGAGALQFALPAMLFFRQTATAGLAGEAIAYRPETKIASLIAAPTSGIEGLDVAVLIATAFVALLAPFAFRFRFAPASRGALACVLLAFVLMPWGIGPAVNLDVRMPLALMLIGIAATDVGMKPGRTVLAASLFGMVALVLLARTVGVGAQAASFADLLAQYRSAFQQLPADAVLFTGLTGRCPRTAADGGGCVDPHRERDAFGLGATLRLLYPEIYRTRLEMPRHIAALATIERGVFVPQIFATRGLQPIAVRPSLQTLRTLQGENPMVIATDAEMAATSARLLEEAENALPGRPVFLLQQRIEGAVDPAPAGAAVVARGPQFTLYRLSPP
ncbi:MAG: hypothetical protein U0S49_01665 [Rhodospirillales bacterium]|nr:hypothetical protein [Rhodospirillales bacterium]